MSGSALESRSAASARDELIAAIASTADEAQRLTYRLFLAIYDDLGRRLDALHEDESHRADHALIATIREEREAAARDAANDRRVAREQFIRQTVIIGMSLAVGAVGAFVALAK